MDQGLVGLEPEMLEPPAHKGRLIKIVGLVAALAVLAAAALFFWNRQGHLSEQESLSRAQAFMASGQIHAAIIELKNALQANPRNPQARLKLARLYLNQGKGAEAEEQLILVRELVTDTKIVTLPLAEAEILQRKYDKVLQEIKPDNFVQASEQLQAVRIRADALLGLGRLNEACPMFQQTLAADPRHVAAYLGLAKCAVARRDLPAAKADIEAALNLEPRNLRSLMLKGEVAQAMADSAGAETAYGLAVDADPDNVDVLLARAMARLSFGKNDLAAKDVEAARSRAPKSLTVRYMQALIAFRQSLSPNQQVPLEDAQSLILGVIGSAPEHIPSRMLSGYVAYRLGQYHRADKDLSAALVSMPDNRAIRLALANIRLKSGQPEQALAALEPLLADSGKDAEILVTAADAYMKMGHQSKAAEVMAKAAALDLQEPSMRAKIGLGRLLAGDLAGATKEFDSAAKLGAPYEQTMSWRIMAHLTRREFDDALKLAEELAKQVPASTGPHHLKGMAYLGKQDLDQARMSFERALKIKPTDMTAARSLARLDLQQGKPDATRARYEAVLKQAPKHYEAMMELAMLAKAQDHDADYILWLSRAAEATPHEATPRISLARHYLTKKRPDKALTWARQAHDLDLRNPSAMEVLGDAQLANGDKDSASYTYLQWTLVEPKSTDAQYKLGWSQMAIGQPIAARESLDRALRLQPDHLNAAVAQTVLALKDRRPKDALVLAQQIQRYHSNNWQGYSLAGDSHAAQGQHTEAAKAYAQALALNPNNQLFVRQYQALTQAGKAEQAQQAVEAWLKASPRDVGSRLYLGYALLQTSHPSQAVAHFQAVLKLDANNADALAGMAAALHAQNDVRALQYAEKAYAQSGGSAGTSYLLGKILLSRNDTRRALDLLQQAVSLAPQSPGYRVTLAAAWVQSGNKATARDSLETLLAKGGDFPQRAEAQALLLSLPKPVVKSNVKP